MTHGHLSVERIQRTLWDRRQQLLPGTSRRLNPPRCPNLVPQPTRHEAQSRRKSVPPIRILIHHHARTRDQEQTQAKVSTTTATATTAPSAAERGGVEQSNLSSAWGGSFDTPIPDGPNSAAQALLLGSGAQHSALVDLKNSSILLFGAVMWTRVEYLLRSVFVIHEVSF